jgi:DNA-binding response OmpR family regulator
MHQSKILVADDSRAVRVCLERVLKGAGYEVSVACDGAEAVQLAREVAPDLVILDIQMPEMDGYAACDQILQNAQLPVIFLTRSRATQLDVLGHQLGAYIPKPADDQMLLDTVRELLQSASTSSH